MRTAYCHDDIVNLIKPDILITQSVERYLPSTKSDDERPALFMYPHFKGAPYQPSQEFAEAMSAVLSFGRPPYQNYLRKIGLR